MVPSGAMESSFPKEESFRLIPVQGSLGPISEVHGVCSNRDLPSTSGGQLWAIEISYMFCESWATLINNSKEGFSCLILELLLDGLWLLGTALPSQDFFF